MSDLIDSDPFWSVVRRRHPDIDIVLLPPDRPVPADSGQAARAPEPFAREHIAEADAVWAALVGHGMPLSTTRWIPGPTGDSICHSVTLTLGDVEDAIGLAHVRTAAELLSADGWTVFIPPTGMPRVTADRAADLGSERMLLGYAADPGNLFLQLTSAGVPVGTRTAHELIGAEA